MSQTLTHIFSIISPPFPNGFSQNKVWNTLYICHKFIFYQQQCKILLQNMPKDGTKCKVIIVTGAVLKLFWWGYINRHVTHCRTPYLSTAIFLMQIGEEIGKIWKLFCRRGCVTVCDFLIWYGCGSEDIAWPILNRFTWKKLLKIRLSKGYKYSIQNLQYIHGLPLILPQFDSQKRNWNRTAKILRKTLCMNNKIWFLWQLEQMVLITFFFWVS